MQRILVGVDASPLAASVVAGSVDLARATGAKLRLFRAVPVHPEVPWDTIRTFPPGGLEKLVIDEARVELEELAQDVPLEHLDGVAAAVGKPWASICRAAREYEADLIMIGSHGHDATERALGTTAAKVVNHADRSVMVVRPPPERAR